MRRRLTPPRASAATSSGATIVEFAMILPVMCMLLLGVLDLGYRSYVTSIVQGALHEAARMATVGGVPTAQIDTQVQQPAARILAPTPTIDDRRRELFDFTGVARPETITQDTAPLGSYNPGDCFEDANGNSSYDLDRGRGGMGGAEDIVRFEVTMTYPRIVPIGGFLGLERQRRRSPRTRCCATSPIAGRNTGVTVRCS